MEPLYTFTNEEVSSLLELSDSSDKNGMGVSDLRQVTPSMILFTATDGDEMTRNTEERCLGKLNEEYAVFAYCGDDDAPEEDDICEKFESFETLDDFKFWWEEQGQIVEEL